MKSVIAVICMAIYSIALAEKIPNFIQVDNYYIYRTLNNNALKAFKVLRIDNDWMYVEHFRKRDSYVQNFWISINNKNIKYISSCNDKNLHESEKDFCDLII